MEEYPLHYACLFGNIEEVKRLTECYSLDELRINQCGNYGETPLHLAAMEGNIEMAKILLAKRANISLGVDYISTPLHYAVIKGHIEMIKLLLSHGAYINAKGPLGETPLKIAPSEIKDLLENFDYLEIKEPGAE